MIEQKWILDKLTVQEDDLGNEIGLGIKLQKNLLIIRNAVSLGYGPLDKVGKGLRELADWIDNLENG